MVCAEGVWATPPAASFGGRQIDDVLTPDEPLRVLVVSDDPLARAGLAALLGEQSGLIVAGQTMPAIDLARLAEGSAADVVVWDAGHSALLPESRRLGALGPPVLLLAAPGTRAQALPPPGARGLISRDLDPPALVAAVQAVGAGLVVIDPALWAGSAAAGSTVPARSPDRSPVVLLEPLTRREIDVLQWLAAGLSNRQIGERLGISEHTVRFHLNAVFSKLAAHTRTEAVSRAARLGLIAL
jgi:two-component system nitrate/nitrite response regulator NarL